MIDGVEEPEHIVACCGCGKADETCRTILMLDKKAPEPGTGWGCLECHLPMDGALAIMCDYCVKHGVKPKEAIRGYLYAGSRIPIAELTGSHVHDDALHESERGIEAVATGTVVKH